MQVSGEKSALPERRPEVWRCLVPRETYRALPHRPGVARSGMRISTGTGVDETTPRGEGTSSLLAAAWEGGTVLLSRTRVNVNAVTAQPVI